MNQDTHPEYTDIPRHTAYIGLGSNLGDTAVSLCAALEALRGLAGVELAGVSPVYLTEPQGDPDQPWFANQVARLVCPPEMTPLDLLRALQDIEHRLGRTRDAMRRFGPRAMDLDLLAFDAIQCCNDALTLPHPRMHERAFVLVPLCDLEPELELPDGRTPRELLRSIPYRVLGQRIFQSSTLEKA